MALSWQATAVLVVPRYFGYEPGVYNYEKALGQMTLSSASINGAP
jgi:hypothetical protein